MATSAPNARILVPLVKEPGLLGEVADSGNGVEHTSLEDLVPERKDMLTYVRGTWDRATWELLTVPTAKARTTRPRNK